MSETEAGKGNKKMINGREEKTWNNGINGREGINGRKEKRRNGKENEAKGSEII